MTEQIWGSPSDSPGHYSSKGAMKVLELLADILELLAGGDDSPGSDESPSGLCLLPPFCRVAVYPGLDVPWDSCGTGPCDESDGQLWAAIQSIARVPSSDAGSGNCQVWQFTAQIGAVRCASKMDEDGNPPPVDEIQQDAIRQARDADGIRYAITCCPERPRRLIDAGIVLDSWVPLGPNDCVGGAWTIRGRIDVCC
jgi:hypothetical protein